jgi:hypothetical protein
LGHDLRQYFEEEMSTVGHEVVFLNTVSDGPALAPLLDAKDRTLLSFSLEASLELERRKLEFRYADDMAPFKVFGNLAQLATNMAYDWDAGFSQETKYNEVDVGRVVGRELNTHFVDCLKSYIVAMQALKKFQPTKVHCSVPIPYGRWSAIDSMPVYAHLPYALEALCKAQDIPFETIQGIPNVQRFEVRRDERAVFDLAVKGRDTLRWFTKKLSLGSKKHRRVLSVTLKRGMFDTLNEYCKTKDLELIPYFPSGDLLGSGAGASIEAAARMETAWKRSVDDGTFLKELPGPFAPVRDVFKIDVENLLKGTVKDVLREIDHMRSLLRSLEIDFMLVLEDMNPLGKARVAVAQALGVPSAVIQHGFYGRKWTIPYKPPWAGYNFLWGPGFVDLFTGMGFPKDGLKITGVTSVDIIFEGKFTKEGLGPLLDELGVPKDKKIVLWTTVPTHGGLLERTLRHYEHDIRGVFNIMKDRPEALVVKPHQLESVQTYKDIAAEVGYSPVICDKHLAELLSAADVVIASNTTVGLQALLAGKPLIMFTSQNEGDYYGYTVHGVAEPAFSLSDLPKALDKVMKEGYVPDKKVVEDFLEKYAPKRDGSGMTAVIDTVLEILDHKKPKEDAQSPSV